MEPEVQYYILNQKAHGTNMRFVVPCRKGNDPLKGYGYGPACIVEAGPYRNSVTAQKDMERLNLTWAKIADLFGKKDIELEIERLLYFNEDEVIAEMPPVVLAACIMNFAIIQLDESTDGLKSTMVYHMAREARKA